MPVTNDGRKKIIDLALGNDTLGTLQIGLVTNGSLSDSSAYGDLTELSGNGYARQNVTYGAGTDANPSVADASAVSFTASGGDWSTAYYAVLIEGGDTLVGFLSLNSGSGRAVLDGQTLNVDTEFNQA